ncbi:MAG: hypothetical protein Q9162_007719 [Coniocarpon cinnabarinum]
MSSVDTDSPSSPPPQSPATIRPTLKTAKTMAVPQQVPKMGLVPEPLRLSDRNRSNSESRTMTRRQKRMGVHVSRGGNSSGEMSLAGSIDNTNDTTSHSRDTSAGSRVLEQMHASGIRENEHRQDPFRLQQGNEDQPSTLRERKRTSYLLPPDLLVAEAIVDIVDQMEMPIKRLVNAATSSGLIGKNLDRSCTAAFARRGDLAKALRGERDPSRDNGHKRLSAGHFHELCDDTMDGFEHLIDFTLDSLDTILANGRKRDLRMLVTTVSTSVYEVMDLWNHFKEMVERVEEANASQQEDQEAQVTVRPTSPAVRPITSLRIKDPNYRVRHVAQGSSINKPLQSPRSIKSTSQNSLHSRMQSYANSSSKVPEFGPPTPAMTNSSSFPSEPSTDPSDTDEEDRAFEPVFKAMNNAAKDAFEPLNVCKAIFHAMIHGERTEPSATEKAIYQRLLEYADVAYINCGEFRTRLETLPVHEAHQRSSVEFWQSYAHFSKAFKDFAKSIRAYDSQVNIPPVVIRMLKPVHKSIRDSTVIVGQSPWRDLVNSGPTSASPSSAVHGQLPFSRSNPPPTPAPAPLSSLHRSESTDEARVKDPPSRDLPARPGLKGLGLKTSRASPTLSIRTSSASSTSTIRPAIRASSRLAYDRPAPSAEPTPIATTTSDSHFGEGPAASRPASRYAPSLPDLSPATYGTGSRSGNSSGYNTPLPPTPMSAALGPAVQATFGADTNTGTVKKISPFSDHAGSHAAQHGFDNVMTNGHLGSTPASYAGLATISSGRPTPIERSVSAAGYSSGAALRGAGRNVGRSASQRR